MTEKRKPMSILQDLIEDDGDDKPPYITLIDQLFSFIGSDPEKAVSLLVGISLYVYLQGQLKKKKLY